MSILLTGGAGYIGTHTAVELVNGGYEVIIVDNYSNSSPEALRRVERITGTPIAAYKADVCDRNAMSAIFKANKIDAVIHFAGFKAVGESVREPLRYYQNNLDSTIILLELAEHYNVPKLIFSSSATVYGTPETLPMTESMNVGLCASPYGWTKLMSERIISDYAAAHEDFSAVLLRYFNPVGAHPSGLIGEDPKGIPNNLMPFISQVAVGRRDKLQIFGNDYPTPDGTGVRDYIHVVDLAKGHAAALKYNGKPGSAEVINLGTGRGCSVMEMVETFSRVNKVAIPYEIAPRRDGDIAAYYADPAKAAVLLNWRTELSIEDMCRDSWNWQTKNPEGYGA